MGWGIKDILTRPFDPITNAIDHATREVLHQLGGVFDDIASAMDDVYNMVRDTNITIYSGVQSGNIGMIVAIVVIVIVAIFLPVILTFLAELAMEFAFVAFAMMGELLSFGFLMTLAYGVMLGTIGGLLLAFAVPGSVWAYIAQASPWLGAVLRVIGWIFPQLAVLCAVISIALSAALMASSVVFLAMGLPGTSVALPAYDWAAEGRLKEDMIQQLESAGYTRDSASAYIDSFSNSGVWDPTKLVALVRPGSVVDDGGVKLPPAITTPSNTTDFSQQNGGNNMAGAIVILLLVGYWLS